MILYYKVRKQRIDQKLASQKNIANQTVEQMNKIAVKGEQTVYNPKSDSPQKHQFQRKKSYTIFKDQNQAQGAKIRFSSWKTK